MQHSTLTFTARCQTNPNKVATFTLHEDEVVVELGSALVEQIERLLATATASEEFALGKLLEPAATGSLQRLLQPIPLADIDARLDEGALRLTAWIRAGGLRLLPITIAWDKVDNVAGARAFVAELTRRREALTKSRGLASLFDYWVSWLILAGASLAIPLIWLRKRLGQPTAPEARAA